MNALNQIILEGYRCNTTDKTFNGIPIAEFTLKVPRTYKNGNGKEVQEVSEFQVYANGLMAQKVLSNESHSVRIVGRLKQEIWEDDGRKKSRIVVLAEHIEFREVEYKEFENEEDVLF